MTLLSKLSPQSGLSAQSANDRTGGAQPHLLRCLYGADALWLERFDLLNSTACMRFAKIENSSWHRHMLRTLRFLHESTALRNLKEGLPNLPVPETACAFPARFNAQFGLQESFQSLIVLLYCASISQSSVGPHDQAMNILAKLVFMKNALRQLHRLRPVPHFLRNSGQRFQQPQILLAVIGPLLLDPGFITSLHKLAAIKCDCAFISAHTLFKVPCASCLFAFVQQTIELFDVDADRKTPD